MTSYGHNTTDAIAAHLAKTATVTHTDDYKEYHDADGTLLFDEIYHPNGRVATRTFVNADRYIHGTRTKYDINGVLTEQSQWRNGDRHGVTKKYQDGVLIKSTTYRAGEKHGEQKKYNLGGQLAKSTMYREGEKHGLQKIYNGDYLFKIGKFDNGRRVGKHSTYDVFSGKLAMVTPYNSFGRKDGLEKEYYNQTDATGHQKIKSTTPYTDGMRDGITRAYDVNGMVTAKERHVLDVRVARPIFWLAANWDDIKAVRLKKLVPALWHENTHDTLQHEKADLKDRHQARVRYANNA